MSSATSTPPERQEQLDKFYDEWLSLQATSKRENTIEDVKRLMQHEAFNPKNPNRIRALIGAFCMANFRRFHAADGSGYKLLADFVIELDPINPQIASRLVQAMIRWRRFDAESRKLMKEQLQRVMSVPSCSVNTYEIVARAVKGEG